jgi:hypothetical protein
MRQLVNDYIRDNLFKVVWTSPSNSEPFFDAIHGEGFTTGVTGASSSSMLEAPGKLTAVKVKMKYRRRYIMSI